MVHHLHAVYERNTRLHGRRNMYGFSHLRLIGPFFKTGIGVSVNAIRTFVRMRDRQSDQRLFTLGGE